MFVVVGEDKCPTCGITGKLWKKSPDVFICPQCNAYYNEFGIIIESQIDNELSFT